MSRQEKTKWMIIGSLAPFPPRWLFLLSLPCFFTWLQSPRRVAVSRVWMTTRLSSPLAGSCEVFKTHTRGRKSKQKLFNWGKSHLASGKSWVTLVSPCNRNAKVALFYISMCTKLILNQVTDSICQSGLMVAGKWLFVRVETQKVSICVWWQKKKSDHFSCCCLVQMALELSLLTRWDLRSELQSEL